MALEINDKRKFTADGEPITATDGKACWRCKGSGFRSVEETMGSPGDHPCPECHPDKTVAVTDAEVQKFLAEAPKVYDDPRPLNDRVLIKQHQAETTYAGTTFIIPDVAQKNPNAGVVIAIGPEVDPEKDCAPNDLVIFNVYSAEAVELDGEKFVHVSKHDIHLRQRVSYAVAAH